MGFFDKIKSAVNTASKKVGEFAKKTASDIKAFGEKREAEIAEKEKLEAQNAEATTRQVVTSEDIVEQELQKATVVEAKPETVGAQPKTKEFLDEHIKTMYCKPTKQELKDELKLLHKIGAIDNDNIYVGGSVNFKTKATSLGSFFKTNKDKNFLSYNDGVFYCSYYNHEEKFMAYKYFLKSDVGEVDIRQETMENKIVLTGKDGFPLLTLDVTDNAKMLEAFAKLLK